MTRPKLALCAAGSFIALVLGCAVFMFDGLQRAFISNPLFNSLILVTLLVGITAAVRQLLRIDQSAQWMARRIESHQVTQSVPFLLVPLSPLVNNKNPQPTCSAMSLRAMLDGVFTRLDDSRDLSRYLMNVLILLGLLGTFWGLLETVGGIGAVIGGMSLGSGDVRSVFEGFKDGLQKPLAGMGVSFSASLFGLASSLILGFLDLQAGRAQNLFCAELEEILGAKDSLLDDDASQFSGMRFPMTVSGGSGIQEAVVHGLTDQLDRLQRTLRQQVELRVAEQANSRTLQEILVALDTHLTSQHDLLAKLVSLQQEASPVVGRLATLLNSSSVTALEHHARSIDLSVKEFARQLTISSEIQTEELRSELRVIARLMAEPNMKETELLVG